MTEIEVELPPFRQCELLIGVGVAGPVEIKSDGLVIRICVIKHIWQGRPFAHLRAAARQSKGPKNCRYVPGVSGPDGDVDEGSLKRGNMYVLTRGSLGKFNRDSPGMLAAQNRDGRASIFVYQP